VDAQFPAFCIAGKDIRGRSRGLRDALSIYGARSKPGAALARRRTLVATSDDYRDVEVRAAAGVVREGEQPPRPRRECSRARHAVRSSQGRALVRQAGSAGIDLVPMDFVASVVAAPAG